MTSCAKGFRCSSDRGLEREVTFMVHDDEPVGLDGLQLLDDERVVLDSRVMLVEQRWRRSWGSRRSPNRKRLLLRGDRPGAANAGRKVMEIMSQSCWALTASTTPRCCAPGARGDYWVAAAGIEH